MARNGPEFEKMTMEKQKDNPKFSFLFGGEFYSYHKCKLALEQQQRESSPALRPPPSSPSFLRFHLGSTTKRLIWGRMLFLCEKWVSSACMIFSAVLLSPAASGLQGQSIMENEVIDLPSGFLESGIPVVLQT